MSDLLFWNLFSAFFMTGLIWFVQLHYYLYKEVKESNFARYERMHSAFTFFIVMPPMIVELYTSYYLYVENPTTLYYYNLVIVVVIWISTWLFQVPTHLKLFKGFDAKYYKILVYSNWFRVVAWSTKSYLLYLILNS